MESVGQKLREARLRLDLTLAQVSVETRITLKNLEAIEANDLSRINSPFFYRSFVRQFAAKVQVDYDAIAAAVAQATSTMPEPLIPGQGQTRVIRVPGLKRKKPSSLKWVGSIASFWTVLVACSGMYSVWQNSDASWAQFISDVNSSFSGLRVERPRMRAPMQGNEAAALCGARPAPRPFCASSSTAVISTGKQAKSVGAAAKPAASPNSIGNDTAREQAPDALPADTQFHIQLSAIERSWLSIIADGKEIFSGILDPADSKALDGHDSARIRTGNAGGLVLTFNGKAMGVLGRRGQVRTLVFTKDNYQVLPPAPQVALAGFIQADE